MKKLLVLVFAIALCLGVLCVGASAVEYDQNGFGYDGSYEPATPVDDVYQIGNAGQLYWFAQQVNGGEYGANAELTANITINENVLKENGELNSGTFREWTPIGTDYTKAYTGTFDGQSHTISGLYYSDTNGYCGLFGYVGSGGQVKNVKVDDSYINDTVFVGGVCGYNYGGTITNCSFDGSVTGTSPLTLTGGVCGINDGTLTNCYNTGSVTGVRDVGGVCGSSGYSSTITNCYNDGSVTATGDNANVGGVCGQNDSTITNCYNTGSVTGTGESVGGVCGRNDGTITNCYNTGDVTGTGNGTGTLYVGGVSGYNYFATIENCYSTGSVNGTSDVGGVCGHNYFGTITNCYNTGSVSGTDSGTYTGGVCGENNGTITNCYNMGKVSGGGNNDNVGGVCGCNDNRSTITNCYWREVSGLNGWGINNGTVTNVEPKTNDQFTSGEVAWLLNSDQEDGPWRQDLIGGNDNYPTLDSTQGRVFQVMLDETDCYCNDSFTIPASPSRPGYTFDEWNTAADGTGTPYEEGDQVTILTTEQNGTVTLYAQWTANEYTVQFDPNDGEGEMTGQDFTYDETKSLTTNIFTHTGYTFDEWNTAADGTGTPYKDGQQVSNLTTEPNGTVTLYAQWTVNTYTVTLNLNNGKFVEGYQGITSYTYGTTTLLPDAEQVTRSGYRFEGWYADEKFQDGPYTQISAADLGNKTFYARWSFINIPTPNSITVTQPANGTVKVNPSNGSAGTLITVTATPDEGYELAYITVDGEKITGNTFRMPDKSVTVSAVFVPATFPFVDVKTGDWFYDYVAYVYANGLMDGTSATTFEPNANMTRAMVWAILARIDGETVTGAAWATDARAWAMAEGVSDGTDPNGLVTREQFATMLYRYAVAKGYDVSIGESTNILSYADFASISEYAIPAMQWACGSGIVTGVTDSTLAPQGTATRAQCAAMLMRFAEL